MAEDTGTTIESLQIQVEASASQAQQSISVLTRRLKSLAKACDGGCGLQSIINELNSFNGSLDRMNGFEKLANLAQSLKSLTGIKKFSLSPDIAPTLTSINTVVSSMSADAGLKLQGFAGGLSSLAQTGRISIPATTSESLMSIAKAGEYFSAHAGDFSAMREVLQTLHDVGKINVSASAGTNLLDLSFSLQEMSKVDLSKLKNISGALSGIASLKLSKATVNNVQALGEAAETLNGKDFSGLSKLNAELTKMSASMPTITQNIRPLTTALGALETQTERNASSANKTGTSYVNLYAVFQLARHAIQGISRVIGGWIDKSNSYIENVNLFTASMGEYAKEAQNFAERVGDLMGIDPGSWMRNQGVFQTLSTGFGVSAERAAIMSKNLTQLGYDLSSFFNIAVEGEGGAMQKLQAGLAGELEPLRRLGFDLSEARLKAVALSLGIDKTYKSMNQAEKAQLRYYAILNQVTIAQGDMARTLNSPANQLRILKAQVEQAARALGNIFIPILNAVLPYLIAVAKGVRLVASAIAGMVEFKMPEVDYSGISTAASAAQDLDAGLSGAGKSAKNLNELLADWDELNIIASESGGGSGGGAGAGIDGSEFDFDLPEYDFLAGLVESNVEKVMQTIQPAIDWITTHLRDILSVAAAVGGVVSGWKIASRFIPSLKTSSEWADTILAGVGSIAAAAATVMMNIYLTTQFLDKEDAGVGTFLAGIGSDVAGAWLTSKLVQAALTGKSYAKVGGQIALGTTLIATAATSIKLALDNIDANGFNLKNALTLLKGAAEAGVGGGLVLSKVLGAIFGPMTTGETIGLGLGTFFATLSVSLGIALTKGVCNTDNATILDIIGGLLSSAVGGALGGASIGFAFKSAEAGFVAGGIIATASSVLNLVTLFGKAGVDGEFSEAEILSSIGSAVGTALGVAAIAVGLGAGLPAAALAGGVALAVTGLAILGFAVSVANSDTFSITWGSETLTKEQMEKKVAEYFGFDVKSHINSITATVDDTTTITADISSKVSEIEEKLPGITVGLATDTSLTSISQSLIGVDGNGGLIGDLKKLVEQNSLTLANFINLDGKVTNDEGTLVSAISKVESDAARVLDEQGAKWGQWFADGFKGVTEEQIRETLSYIQELTNAALKGTQNADFEMNLANLKIGDMDRDTALGTLQAYKDLENELWASYQTSEQEAYKSLMSDLEIAKVLLKHTALDDAKYAERENTVKTLEAEAEAYLKDITSGEYSKVRGDFDARVASAREQLTAEMAEVLKTSYENGDFKNLQNVMGEWFERKAAELTHLEWSNEGESEIREWANMSGEQLMKIFAQGFHDKVIADDSELAELLSLAPKSANFTDLFASGMQKEMFESFQKYFGEDATRKLTEYLKIDYDTLFGNIKEPVTIAPPDTSEASAAVTEYRDTCVQCANDIQRAYDIMSGRGYVGYAPGGGTGGGGAGKYGYLSFRAGGGFPETGEMFVARESGPELVGTIGGRTAVANNGQIEDGIAEGVRDANSDLSALLDVANRYLRVIASKTGQASFGPSVALAETVKRSEELRLQAQGV